jgi:cyclophilin family peptidyl-prolyl cis-trans isomerase/HEAT repeat protein
VNKPTKLLAVGYWLLATACATVPPGNAVLSEENVREYAALLRMTDARVLDTAVIDRGLASTSTVVRAEAARAVAQVGRAKAAPRIAALRSLLRGTSAEVGAQAAYSLGLLRDTASVPDLVEALTWSAPVAREAAWALGQIGNAARDALEGALARGHQDPGTRIQLLLASAKLTPVPAQAVVDYFDDKDPSVVWAAAYAISRTRTVPGVRALWGLGDSLVANRPVLPGSDKVATSDPMRAPYIDPESAPYRIRAEIARVLVRSVAGDSLAVLAIPSLARYARDSHPHVRINALRALGSYGALTRAYVVAGTRDSDPNVRVAAAQALGAARDSAQPDWATLWAADSGLTYRQALIESAMGFGTELPAVAEWRTDGDWRRRATVGGAAASAPSAEHRLRLASPLLTDPDPRVRAAAIAGIAPDTASVTDEVRALLRTAIGDSDRMVSERATARLTGRAEREEEPPAPVRDMKWYEDIVRTIVAPALGGRPVRARLQTERGPVVVELFAAEAPLTVRNFLDLARNGTFRGTRFHRVVPNFVVQDGDPRGDGTGGPGYSIRDELNPHRYERGVLGMALSGPDTGGSQWFITHSPQPHLDGGYTVFGRVVSGFGALDRIVQGDLVIDIR